MLLKSSGLERINEVCIYLSWQTCHSMFSHHFIAKLKVGVTKVEPHQHVRIEIVRVKTYSMQILAHLDFGDIAFGGCFHRSLVHG